MNEQTNSYEAPKLTVLGSFEQLTQAAATGSVLDQAQPSGVVPLLKS